MSSHTYQVTGANIVYEVFDGEVVAVNLDSGKYYSIRSTGAFIWNALMLPSSVELIVKRLSETKPNQATEVSKEVQDFVNQLCAEGLIGPSSAPALSVTESPTSSEYAKPSLEIYSDMQEILLLDPVHDVDEAGWPIAQK